MVCHLANDNYKNYQEHNNNSAITIRLANNELSDPHELMLTKTQINKLQKQRAKVWVQILKYQKHKYEKQ